MLGVVFFVRVSLGFVWMVVVNIGISLFIFSGAFSSVMPALILHRVQL